MIKRCIFYALSLLNLCIYLTYLTSPMQPMQMKVNRLLLSLVILLSRLREIVGR